MRLQDNYKDKYQELSTLGFNIESNLYINQNLLYKIYKPGIDLRAKEKIVNKLMSLYHIDNCILPKEKIYIEDNFSGIVLDYKKGYNNLADVYKKFGFEQALNMGKQLSMTLKQIHQVGLVIGDIHGDNIITNYTQSYFCDLDGIKICETNDEIKSLYTIMYNDCSPEILDNKSTDNIKLLIYILSAIYKYDFEYLLKNKGTEYMQKLVQNLELDNSIKYIMMEIFNIGSEQIYFHEYYDKFYDCQDGIEFDKRRITNKVKILLY